MGNVLNQYLTNIVSNDYSLFIFINYRLEKNISRETENRGDYFEGILYKEP